MDDPGRTIGWAARSGARAVLINLRTLVFVARHTPALIALFVLLGPADGRALTQDTRQLTASKSSLPGEGSDPVVLGPNIYAAVPNGVHLTLVVSNNSGITFRRTNLNTAKNGVVKQPRILAYLDHVFFVWESGQQIYFRQSPDAGHTFGPVLLLGPGIKPQIGSDGLNLTVAFPIAFGPSGTRIDVLSSTDGGLTFAPATSISGPGFNREVSIARAGARVYLTWESVDPLQHVLSLLARSSDGGMTFTEPTPISPVLDAFREPIVALSDDAELLFVYGRDASTTEDYGHLVVSRDASDAFDDPLYTAAYTHQGIIRVRRREIYITYLQYSMDWEAMLLCSLDGGASFLPPINLSGPTGVQKLHGANQPSVAFNEDGSITVSWATIDSAFANTIYDVTQPPGPALRLGYGSTAMSGPNAVLWLTPDNGVNLSLLRP